MSGSTSKKRPKAPLEPDDPRHGTTNGYGNLGCRCDACRAAASARGLARERVGQHPLAACVVTGAAGVKPS